MTAYILARIKVTDPVRYGEYVKHTPRVIARFGGRFLIRGGAAEPLEGPAETLRVVVIEFPSMETVRAFYASPDYAVVKALRDGAGEGTFTALDGYDPAEWDKVLTASQALPPPA